MIKRNILILMFILFSVCAIEAYANPSPAIQSAICTHDQTFTAGDTTTITVCGDNVMNVEVIGVNSQIVAAGIKINGESKSVFENDEFTLGGVNVRVVDILFYTAPVTSGAVRLEFSFPPQNEDVPEFSTIGGFFAVLGCLAIVAFKKS